MSSSAHAWWDIVQVNIMFRHVPNVSANKKTMRSCLPDLPNKRDVNNHRIIKVSHYWTFLLWIWNSLVQKPHLRKMNTYHNQPLPKVWRIFWHSDIFSDVSMQYPFHHVCHEIGKISTAAPVWLWIKIECQRDWKMQNYPPTKLGTTLSPFLFKSWHKDVKICCIAQDILEHDTVVYSSFHGERVEFFFTLRLGWQFFTCHCLCQGRSFSLSHHLTMVSGW